MSLSFPPSYNFIFSWFFVFFLFFSCCRSDSAFLHSPHQLNFYEIQSNPPTPIPPYPTDTASTANCSSVVFCMSPCPHHLLLLLLPNERQTEPKIPHLSPINLVLRCHFRFARKYRLLGWTAPFRFNKNPSLRKGDSDVVSSF